MNKEQLILCFVLIVIISISGCGVMDKSQGNFTPEYKDEALKMKTEITGKALPGQAINMKIYLTNQVEHEIKNVEFRVADFYGLDLISEICDDDGEKITENSNIAEINPCSAGFTYCGCYFNRIQSLDEKEINFVFKIPNQDEIARIGRELKPEFTLKYDYFGETIFLIPILGPYEKSTKAKSDLIQTKGPIHVEIERGFTTSSDPWERSGSGFSIIIKVKDVVNSRNEMEITNTSFKLTLTNLNVDQTFGRCDFSGTPLIPNEKITLPMTTPLVCALSSNIGDVPWTYGEVRANYDYRYKVVKTENIEVETIIA